MLRLELGELLRIFLFSVIDVAVPTFELPLMLVRNFRSGRVSRGVDDRREALAHADAERGEAEASRPVRTHLVHEARDESARRSSRAGVRSAIAPPFGFTLASLSPRSRTHGDALGGECLVEFDQYR